MSEQTTNGPAAASSSAASDSTNAQERVTLVGVRADGSSKVLGSVPMPPEMKRREIVTNFFERPSDDPDDCSDANMCLYALEQYHEWLLQQGWTPPPMVLEGEQFRKQNGIAPGLYDDLPEDSYF